MEPCHLLAESVREIMSSIASVVRTGVAVLPVVLLGGLGAKAFISPRDATPLAVSAPVIPNAVTSSQSNLTPSVETATSVESTDQVSLGLSPPGTPSPSSLTPTSETGVEDATPLALPLPIILPVRSPIRPS